MKSRKKAVLFFAFFVAMICTASADEPVKTVITKEWGYNGDIELAVKIFPEGKIGLVEVLKHNESPKYVSEDALKKFLSLFAGKKITDKFELGKDIDGITGATFTCRAISRAVQKASGKKIRGKSRKVLEIQKSSAIELPAIEITGSDPRISAEGALVVPKYNEVKPQAHEALFYEQLADNAVKCGICPWNCAIKPGRRGSCGVRQNINGKLVTLVYSRPATIHIDPIEKKPFFHFYPGSEALSLAAAGCNVTCKFCQNWEIAQAKPEDIEGFYIPPDGIIRLAKRTGSKIIAITYSEPTVNYEYMLDIARLAKKEGIKTTIVSNGFINPEPLKLLCKYVDAIKVDLKSFSEKYYAEIVGGRLEPVLETIKNVKKSGVHLEIVYLVVPTLNDNPEEIKRMSAWLKKNAGSDVPVHFSRFHPQYKMLDYPSTPVSTVENLRKIAMGAGLKYVYVGNVPPGNEGEITACPACGKALVRRLGFHVTENNILPPGKCRFCGQVIYGRY